MWSFILVYTCVLVDGEFGVKGIGDIGCIRFVGITVFIWGFRNKQVVAIMLRFIWVISIVFTFLNVFDKSVQTYFCSFNKLYSFVKELIVYVTHIGARD